MITLLHWGMPKLLQYYKVCVCVGGSLGTTKSDYAIYARPLIGSMQMLSD